MESKRVQTKSKNSLVTHETLQYELSYVQVTKKAAHIGGFFVPDDVAKLTLYASSAVAAISAGVIAEISDQPTFPRN